MDPKEAYESAKKALEVAQKNFEEAKAAYEREGAPAWFRELHDAASEVRKESLDKALALGADEATIRKIADAARVDRAGKHIKVATRYGGLSRGKAWARDAGDTTWAEKSGGSVLLTEGKWRVGSSDGFSRKESPVEWKVERVQVGDQSWLIAN